MSETNEKLSPEREELISFRTEKLIRRHKADSVLYWTVLVMTLFAFASAVYSLVKCILGSEEMLETYLNQILMCALALVCLNIPHFFRRRLKVRVPDFISVIVYVFVFLHFVLGEIYRFYDHYMLFDKALHTTGGAIIAFIGFSVVLSFTRLESRKVKLSPFFLVVFAFCFSLSIEYIWELVEYAVDSITYRVAGFAGAAGAGARTGFGAGFSSSLWPTLPKMLRNRVSSRMRRISAMKTTTRPVKTVPNAVVQSMYHISLHVFLYKPSVRTAHGTYKGKRPALLKGALSHAEVDGCRRKSGGGSRTEKRDNPYSPILRLPLLYPIFHRLSTLL